MTESHIATPADARRTSVVTRRAATTVLHAIADHLDVLTPITMVALVITSTGHFGPDWAQLTDAGLAVAFLALYGLIRLVHPGLESLAEWLTPDGRDGQALNAAADIVNAVCADVSRNGAEATDVLTVLHVTALPEQVAGLLDSLAYHAAELDEETKVVLLSAAQGLRDVAQAIRL